MTGPEGESQVESAEVPGERVRTLPRCMPVGKRADGELAAGAGGRHRASRDLLLGVTDRCADGLAGLLPSMVCGEESAVLVFDNERRRVSQDLFQDSQATLNRIAREEETHEAVLRSVAESLPMPAHDVAVRRLARRFFLGLSTPSIGTHFSRIAWLDSGVCIILSSLTRSDSPLRAAPAFGGVLRGILGDEARHVAFCRRYAGYLGVSSDDDRESFARVRGGLVELLEPCAESIELLGVDPDQLFVRLKSRGRHWERA